MLIHGLQKLHDQQILLPRSARQWPDPELLSQRYTRFHASLGA